jgi:hypothetical protein
MNNLAWSSWILKDDSKPSASTSYFSLTFSPMLRISLSINNGLAFVSGCPYQYTRGSNAFDDKVVGADVAAEPKGLAGENVGRGE